MLLDHRDDFLEMLQTLRTNVHNVALRLSEDERNHDFCEKLRLEVNQNINPAIASTQNREFDEAETYADQALTNLLRLYKRIHGKDDDGKELPRGMVIIIYPSKIEESLGMRPKMTERQKGQALTHLYDSVDDAAAEILSYDGVLSEYTKLYMTHKQGDMPYSVDSSHHTRALINSMQLALVTIEGEDKNASFAGVLKRIRENITRAIGQDFASLVEAASKAEDFVEVEIDDAKANEILDKNFTQLDRLLNSQITLKPLRNSEEATAAIPGSFAHMKSCLKKAVRQLEDEKSYEFPDYYRALNRRQGR